MRWWRNLSTIIRQRISDWCEERGSIPLVEVTVSESNPTWHSERGVWTISCTTSLVIEADVNEDGTVNPLGEVASRHAAD